MNKTAFRLGAAAVALLLVTDMTLAASKQENRKRKASIFSEIFSPSPERASAPRKKRRVMFGRDWLDDGRQIRVISGQDSEDRQPAKKRKSPNVITVADEDPEGDPGFGMGNLTYVAEPTVAMVGAKLPAERPPAPDAAAVYEALAAPDATLRVVPQIRDAVVEHYASHGFRPLWSDGGKLSPRGEAILKTLAAAGDDGLDPASYLPPTLMSYDGIPPLRDLASAARLDVEISALAVKYARDASGGRFDPARLSLYHDVKPPRVEAASAIRVLAFTPFPADYLKGLHPTHPAYAAMKAELAVLRAAPTEVTPAAGIEPGAVVKKGQSDPRVPAVRQRLADLGFAQALEAAHDPALLDADLSVQIRLFQKSVGIGVDGMLGNQTVQALNEDHSERDVGRLLDNMERLRWLPRSLGGRHVFVNQAAFEVRVMENGSEIWQSRVIVGKPMTQTVVFNDKIETVVFNPSWGVPPSIIANEYLPKLRRDPGYLDRIGFKVVDAKGKVVPSGAVNWSAYGSKVPFGIQQPPGSDNALGELKFLFPNSHNIYMHDTPTRHLFDEDVRAYSHGCVRVQNPRDFATVLLGLESSEIDARVDGGRSQTVRLETPVPVYLTYFTAWPDETGKIQYFNDIYGRDKTMQNARAGLTVAQR